jgi:uncharacterized protein
MQIENLNLSHQRLLENKFRELNLSLSEYSFANLYLFRELHRYQVIQYNEEIFIKGITRDQVPHIMLTSPPAKISPLYLQSILSEAQILFPIPEIWLNDLERFLLQASFKEEECDYLYAKSKLAQLPGRNLSKKRNLIKQLLNAHEVKAENITKQVGDAEQILRWWQKEHAEDRTETDYKACHEAIKNLDLLRLQGRIIYIDQYPAAFAIGEKISEDCFAVHFSKALRSIKGLYQYLFQDLAQTLEVDCLWINLEQDLGIPGIRDTKRSYLPDRLGRKWRIQLQFS